MGFRIVSDSASNTFEYEGVDYKSVPLKIVTSEREFVDDKDLDVWEMIQYLKTYKGKSGTACPGQGDWITAFGEEERIICVTITSKLSGSYNAARLAKEEYEELHPDRKVYIVDSLSAGGEQKLLIEKLVELSKEDKSFEAVCEEIETYKNHTQLLFSLESLTNLANNGRISPAVAKIGGVLGIRVVGAADDGVLNPLAKCRGEKGVLKEIKKITTERGYVGGKFIINHCFNEEMVEKVRELILEDYPQADIKVERMTGLCSFYAEKGGLILGYEVK